MIVFKDADLDKAANDSVINSLFNCGQGKFFACLVIKGIYHAVDFIS
jgi:acyl-CoA reductase-like NAD-dependent aldehyde dehydrogenase